MLGGLTVVAELIDVDTAVCKITSEIKFQGKRYNGVRFQEFSRMTQMRKQRFKNELDQKLNFNLLRDQKFIIEKKMNVTW